MWTCVAPRAPSDSEITFVVDSPIGHEAGGKEDMIELNLEMLHFLYLLDSGDVGDDGRATEGGAASPCQLLDLPAAERPEDCLGGLAKGCCQAPAHAGPLEVAVAEGWTTEGEVVFDDALECPPPASAVLLPFRGAAGAECADGEGLPPPGFGDLVSRSGLRHSPGSARAPMAGPVSRMDRFVRFADEHGDDLAEDYALSDGSEEQCCEVAEWAREERRRARHFAENCNRVMSHLESTRTEDKRAALEYVPQFLVELASTEAGAAVVVEAFKGAAASDAQAVLVCALHGSVCELAASPHGLAVLETCLRRLHCEQSEFIAQELEGAVCAAARHALGSELLQLVLELLPQQAAEPVIMELLASLLDLCEDPVAVDLLERLLQRGDGWCQHAICEALVAAGVQELERFPGGQRLTSAALACSCVEGRAFVKLACAQALLPT